MRLFYCILIVTALISFSISSEAQNNSVSIGTTSTNSSAVLWLQSDAKNQGFIIPVGDRTKVATPAQGMLIFDTNLVYYYDGTIWNAVGGSGGGKTYTLSVNSANQLVLSDGTTSVPINVPIAGDVTGTSLGITKVTGIQGKAVTLPSSGVQYLSYDVTNSKWVFQTPAGSGDMLKATYDPTNKAADVFDLTKHTGWPANALGVLTNNGSGTLTWAATSITLPSLSANQLLSNNGSNVGINVGGDLTLAVSGTTGTFTVTKLNGKTLPAFASGVLTSDNAGNLSWAATSGTGTVTNVSAAGGTPLSVTSPTTAPVINITAASSSTDGYLKSADFNTFNGKVSLGGDLSGSVSSPTVSKINGKSIPAFAAGVLTSDVSGNLSWAATSGTGTVTNVSVTGGTPLSVTNPTTTPVINISAATTSTNGYLKSTDWNTFNGKVSLGGDLSGTSTLPIVSKVNGSIWPANAAGILTNDGTGTLTWGTTGTVSSVGLSLPTLFTISGSPVTTSGTLTATLASQTANTIFAAPNGSAGTPSFRTLVATDLPTVTIAKGGTGATTATAARTNLGLGSLATLSAVTTTEITDGTITDVDVSTTAAIAGTKISPDFGSQVIATTGQTKFNSLAYAWPNVQTAGTVLANDGAGNLSWASPSSTSWSLLGNAGTTPATNFLGTTDSQPLLLSTAGAERLRIDVAGNVGINNTSPAFPIDINKTLSTPSDAHIRLLNTNVATSAKAGIRMEISGAPGGTPSSPAAWGVQLQTSYGDNWLELTDYAGSIVHAWGYNNYFPGNGTGNLVGTGTGLALMGGNVGIGTTTPAYPLDVAGGINTSGFLYFSGAGASQYIFALSSYFGVTNHWIPNNSNIYDLGTSAYRWRTLYTNNTVNVSDIRLKRDVKPLKYGLSEVLQLRPVSYVLNDDKEEEVRLGLIAQEALKLVPEVVNQDKNSKEKYYGMSYTELIPVLIKAIQEQQKLIENRDEKISKLEESMKTLQAEKTSYQQLKAEIEQIKKSLGLDVEAKK